MKDLNVFILTWNCGRELINPKAFSQYLFSSWDPPSESSSLFPEVIVCTLQEIAPLSYAFLGPSWTKQYFDHFKTAVDLGVKHHLQHQSNGDDSSNDTVHYINVISRNAGLTGIMIFVRDELVDRVKDLQVADVGVGKSDMSNKGAVGVRIGWDVDDEDDGKLMYTTFVSAHLAPFEDEVERRNEDYRQIVANLAFTNDGDAWKGQGTVHNEENTPMLQGQSQTQDDDEKVKTMYSTDSHVFFSGDLNYRTATVQPSHTDFWHFPQPCRDRSNPLHYSHLLEKDQLTQQHEAENVLNGFKERPIDFPPTYKYDQYQQKDVWLDEDLDHWIWAVHRWPSWCDRIFFSSTSIPKIAVGKYISLPLFGTSDHRPVVLSVSIPAAPVTDLTLFKESPMKLNKLWRSRRDYAKRKEFIVGVLSYLAMTWPGNGMIVTLAICVCSGVWWSGIANAPM